MGGPGGSLEASAGASVTPGGMERFVIPGGTFEVRATGDTTREVGKLSRDLAIGDDSKPSISMEQGSAMKRVSSAAGDLTAVECGECGGEILTLTSAGGAAIVGTATRGESGLGDVGAEDIVVMGEVGTAISECVPAVTSGEVVPEVSDNGEDDVVPEVVDNNSAPMEVGGCGM